MHIPSLFEIKDKDLIHQFIKETGFATLITANGAYPVATHIPLELEINEKGESVLWGHISKTNPQWKMFQNFPKILAIFLSPVNSYVSSSWYNHPNAPTWNCMSVHVSGTIKVIEGDELWESVRRLTNRYEKNMANPVSLDTLPASVQKQMNGIVGFEISMDKVEAAFKLSQNRNETDFKNILEELRSSKNRNEQLMADAMEQYAKPQG
ncbi:MAG: FMN-binding negative transcriptional regulator [Bacteroidia bacterium]